MCSLGVSGTSMSMLPSFRLVTMSSEAMRNSRSSADSAAAAEAGMSLARLPDAILVDDEEAPERASVRKSVRRTSEADLEREWPLGFDIGTERGEERGEGEEKEIRGRIGGEEGGDGGKWGGRLSGAGGGGRSGGETLVGAEIVARNELRLPGARAHVGGQATRHDIAKARRCAAHPVQPARWLPPPPPPPPSQSCRSRDSPAKMLLLEDRR